MAAAADSNALSVGDAGRHIDGHRLLGDHAPAAVALAAGVGRDAAVAAAEIADDGAHDLAEGRAGDRLQAPAAPALLAGLDRGARLGAVAAAVLAANDRLVGDREGTAGGGLCEVELELGADIAAGRGPPLAPEDAAAATAAAGAEERLEDVAERAELVEVRLVAAGAQASCPYRS